MRSLQLRPPAVAVESAHALTGTVAEPLRLAVAPSTGRFRPLPPSGAGTTLTAGELLGHVTGGKGRADEVRSPAAGQLRGLLVRPGQLVGRGQPLAWLEGSA